jgi:hypothetical protein
LVAHACNPSYSGGRDQEDRSLNPAQANNFVRPILKNIQLKKGLAEYLKWKRACLPSKHEAPSMAKKCVGRGHDIQNTQRPLTTQ